MESPPLEVPRELLAGSDMYGPSAEVYGCRPNRVDCGPGAPGGGVSGTRVAGWLRHVYT